MTDCRVERCTAPFRTTNQCLWKFLQNLLRPDTDGPANLDKFDYFEPAFAALVFRNERLMAA